ncbi:MAG: radical SAM protein [Candidatus Hydrogenedentes bacterium]|nr:radical SAM protein [Candidatus Hydrogenedentota bacterium]
MAAIRSLRRMGSAARTAAFGVKCVTLHYLNRAPLPLIRGLVLSNRCNLRCRHCKLSSRGALDMTFDEACRVVDDYYREGGRCLYLEGGEPFLWRDGERGLDDIVAHAHRRGYLTVVVYTNGTFPIVTTADTVFVSIDGLHDTHDALRGRSFDRIVANIRSSTHPSMFVNYTINARNRNDIRPFLEFVDTIDRIRAVFFYFHTPYYGYDDLYLGPDERRATVIELLELRKRHGVLNSRAGLLSVLRNDWQRPLAACSVYEGGTVYSCCRLSGDPALCRQCGYLSYAEIDQTWKLKPSAVLNALKYF